MVCRQLNGHVEIGAGHHRIEAALAAGIKTADLYVSSIDDAGMVRIYATENATQRGNAGTAQAGSIISAIRFIAKQVLTGVSVEFNRHQLEIVQGQLQTDKGIGRELILQLLVDVPNINANSVRQQLAILKSSGDYARVITEVQQEIERENKEALKRLAEAEKAQAKAIEAAEKAAAQRKEAAAKAKAAKEEAEKKRAAYAKQRAEVEAELAEKRLKEAAEEMNKFDALRVTRDSAQKAFEGVPNT